MCKHFFNGAAGEGGADLNYNLFYGKQCIYHTFVHMIFKISICKETLNWTSLLYLPTCNLQLSTTGVTVAWFCTDRWIVFRFSLLNTKWCRLNISLTYFTRLQLVCVLLHPANTILAHESQMLPLVPASLWRYWMVMWQLNPEPLWDRAVSALMSRV